MKSDEIVRFISQFKRNNTAAMEDSFTNGNCYYFVLILSQRYNGDIYYDPIDCHFVTKINSNYYDITGDVTDNYSDLEFYHLYRWSEYDQFYVLDYNRVVHYCIDLAN